MRTQLSGVCLLVATVLCSADADGADAPECPSMELCTKCTFSRCKVTNFGRHFPRKAQIEKLLVRDVAVVDLAGCSAWLRNLSFAQWGELLVSNSVSFLLCLDNLQEPLNFNGEMDLVSISQMTLNQSWFDRQSHAFRGLQSVGTYTMHNLSLSKIPRPLAQGLRVTGLLNFANNNIGAVSQELTSYNLKALEDLDFRHNPTCLFFLNATTGMRNWTRVFFGSDSQYLSVQELLRRSVSGLFRRSDDQCADAGTQLQVRLVALIFVAIAVCVLLTAAIIGVRIYRKRSDRSFAHNQL